MFDQQHRDIGGQGRHGLQQFFALAGGHTGHGFVEQQHARLAGQRNRNLQQAAFAVGQHARFLGHHGREVELLQQLFTALIDRFARAQRLPPLAAQALVLRHGERQGFERRERVEQLVDLEGAHHAALHALVRRQARDVLAFERDGAFGGLQHTGQQVDERGLACAVGADERMACALLQVQRDVVGGRDAAKTLDQPLRRQHGVGGRDIHVGDPLHCAQHAARETGTAYCAGSRARAAPPQMRRFACVRWLRPPPLARSAWREGEGAKRLRGCFIS